MRKKVTFASLFILCLVSISYAEDGRTVFGNGDILINELDKAVDGRLLQKDKSDTNLWKTVPYRSEEFAGVMLGGGGGPKQTPITIRLGAKGKYRVFLGLYGGYHARKVRVKLTNDPTHSDLPITIRGNYPLSICEVFWKETDLTDQNLVLLGLGDSTHHPSALAYVRLEAIPDRKASYPLLITNDGNGIFRTPDGGTPEGILKTFETIPKDTCMRMLFWGNGCADNCNYPTKVGNFYPHAGHQQLWQRDFAKNLGNWQENGWDSMKVILDYARKRNWEFQVYIRMEAFKAPFPFDSQENSVFFNKHPEYWCKDREGGAVGRLSYAYPEVQDHMLRLIQEISDYGPDGVCLWFRSWRASGALRTDHWLKASKSSTASTPARSTSSTPAGWPTRQTFLPRSSAA